MITEIIKKIKEIQQQKNNNISNLYNTYRGNESNNKEINRVNDEIVNIENEIANMHSKINSFTFISKITRYKLFQNLNNELISMKEKLSNLNNEKNILLSNKVEFSSEDTILINEYSKVIDMESLYMSGNYEEVYALLFEYFDNDFHKVISFCNDNNIIMDCSDYVNFKFLEYIKNNNNIKHVSKIESLNNIILVRKTVVVPKEDKIIATFFDKSINKIEHEVECFIDGKKISQKISIPYYSAHSTVHWNVNEEVRSHQSAGWDYCDVIILQPMTEKLYNEAANISSFDTWYRKKIDLDSYIVICDSIEKAHEFKKYNQKGTVIIVPKGKVKGSGNLIASSLGSFPTFKIYDGKQDWSVPHESYFSEGFLDNYSKFGYKLHSDSIDATRDATLKFLSRYDKKMKVIINSLNNDSYDFMKIYSAFLSSNENYLNNDFGFLKKDKNFREYIELLGDLGDFGEFFYNCLTDDELDIEKIFNGMIKDIKITDDNKENIAFIRKILISEISKYKADKQEIIKMGIGEIQPGKLYNNICSKIMLIKYIINSPAINKKITDEVNINVPVEYLNFNEVSRLLEGAIDSSYSGGGTFIECLGNVLSYSQSNEVSKKLDEPSLVPNSEEIMMFTNYIKKINIENIEEVYNFIGYLLDSVNITEDEKEEFSEMFYDCLRDYYYSSRNSKQNLNSKKDLLALFSLYKLSTSKCYKNEEVVEKPKGNTL